MKKIIAALLICILGLAIASAPALADDGFLFELTAHGSSNATVAVGETVTVQVKLINKGLNGQDTYNIYSFQTEIVFDNNYLELVAGSVKAADGTPFRATTMPKQSGLRVSISGIDSGEPYRDYPAELLLGSFELKALQPTGQPTMVENKSYKMLHQDASLYDSLSQDLAVTITGTQPAVTEYDITVINPEGGAITTNPAGQAAAGQTVKLDINTQAGYEFSAWKVTDKAGADIDVTDDSFIMPAGNVTVSADLLAVIEEPGLPDVIPGNNPGATAGTPPLTTQIPPARQEIADNEVPLGAFGFADVPENHWAYPYVMYLAGRGFVKGKSDTLFAPSDPITRAEFITILARMSGDSLPSFYSGPFTDVAAGSYYEQAVAWGVSNGIVKGATATTFSPNNYILRQEIAAMIARYATYKGFNLPRINASAAFSDSAQIHGYAFEAVSLMQQADIINGYTDGTFLPLNYATRAEAAKMLAILYQMTNG